MFIISVCCSSYRFVQRFVVHHILLFIISVCCSLYRFVVHHIGLFSNLLFIISVVQHIRLMVESKDLKHFVVLVIVIFFQSLNSSGDSKTREENPNCRDV